MYSSPEAEILGDSQWWPLYVVIAVPVFLLSLSTGKLGFLIGLTVAGALLIAVPFRRIDAADRKRVFAAGLVLLAALIGAWRLDAHTELGVLALAVNRWAVLVITLLAGILGAVTRRRWWLMLQSGIWCLAIAGSGWWLFARTDFSIFLDEWRRYLPPKEQEGLFSPSTLLTFGLADVFALAICFPALLGASAYAGMLARRYQSMGLDSINVSMIDIVALLTMVCALVFTIEYFLLDSYVFFAALGASMLAGLFARTWRQLGPIPVAMAIGATTREAITAAIGGLSGWWGPLTCDWLSFTCTPVHRGALLLISCMLLFVAAAIGYIIGRSIRFTAGKFRAISHDHSEPSPAIVK